MNVLRMTWILGLIWTAPAFGGEPHLGHELDRRVVVTIDDLPIQSPIFRDLETIRDVNDRIVTTLKTERIHALGFVNAKKLFVDGCADPGRSELLDRWLDAGLVLGNHTWGHPSLHRVSVDDFQTEIVKGETILKKKLEMRGMPMRWFRHPYLHTGLDLETKHAVEAFLAQNRYKIAPVTLDNSEWVFAFAYDKAKKNNDGDLMKRIGDAYVPYMERVFAYYEEQSYALFQREIPQVLLIHANRLNADYLGPLLSMIRKRGYRFITMSEALEDAAYESKDTFTGDAGITWIHRWALTQGKCGAFFAGEPEVPEFVAQVADDKY